VTLHQPAVLLVTHDVDEAIRLADRVLMLRDGRFAVDVRIEAPHPRDRADARFLEHRRHLLAELGVVEGGAGTRGRSPAPTAPVPPTTSSTAPSTASSSAPSTAPPTAPSNPR
jgi:sulfonate transport system ATP-binding protein